MEKLYNVIWNMGGARVQINAFPLDNERALALKKDASENAGLLTTIEIVEAKEGDKGNPDNTSNSGREFRVNYAEKAFVPEYRRED